MLEKAQENLFKKIKEGLLDKTSVEVSFKYFLHEWFPKQQISDKDFTRALLDFDDKYSLNHIVILDGKGAVAVRFWWNKRRVPEKVNA